MQDNQKSEQEELEQLKHTLSESHYDTIHPKKFSEVKDVTQNIFSMSMKKEKDLYQYDQRGVTGSSLGYGSL
mgnify:CR=1 FL=1